MYIHLSNLTADLKAIPLHIRNFIFMKYGRTDERTDGCRFISIISLCKLYVKLYTVPYGIAYKFQLLFSLLSHLAKQLTNISQFNSNNTFWIRNEIVVLFHYCRKYKAHNTEVPQNLIVQNPEKNSVKIRKLIEN